MNKLIVEELAIRAGDDWDHTLESDKEFLKKFAELLIEDRDRLLKRSLDILLRIKHDYECKDGLGYDLMLTMAIFDTIKKLQNHLGVKP